MSDMAPASDISIMHDQAVLIPGGRGGTIRPIRDAARAAELARLRWDRVSAEARRGMVDAAKNLPGVASSSPAVVRYLAEQHTLNAADPSAPGSVQSFREVMRIAYPAPERGAAPSTVPAGGMQLNLSPDLARELLTELRARRGG